MSGGRKKRPRPATDQHDVQSVLALADDSLLPSGDEGLDAELDELPSGVEGVAAVQHMLDELASREADVLAAVDRARASIVQRYARRRDPLLVRRGQVSRDVPGFWIDVLRASQISEVITAWDEAVLASLVQIHCQQTPDTLRLTLDMLPNTWFENSSLVKEFRVVDDSIVADGFTQIRWRPDADVPASARVEHPEGEARHLTRAGNGHGDGHGDDDDHRSLFFAWFQQDGPDDLGIALHFAQDIWPNPLAFLHAHAEAGGHEEEGEVSVVHHDDQGVDDQGVDEYDGSDDDGDDGGDGDDDALYPDVADGTGEAEGYTGEAAVVYGGSGEAEVYDEVAAAAGGDAEVYHDDVEGSGGADVYGEAAEVSGEAEVYHGDVEGSGGADVYGEAAEVNGEAKVYGDEADVGGEAEVYDEAADIGEEAEVYDEAAAVESGEAAVYGDEADVGGEAEVYDEAAGEAEVYDAQGGVVKVYDGDVEGSGAAGVLNGEPDVAAKAYGDEVAAAEAEVYHVDHDDS